MEIVEQILNIFEAYRMAPTPKDQYEVKGKDVLRDKITRFVILNQTIQFVMLGFPFKSTNVRDKVLGVLPDLGELLTMKNFAAFNEAIKAVYDKGVQIHIASDGFVFNDILGVPDNVVMDYKEVSLFFGKSAPIVIHDLNDFYSGDNLSEKRIRVMDQFGITWNELEQRILFDDDVNFLYRGMNRFMMEEIAMKTFPSRSQHEKAAKKLTREMMLRNEAYSRLVKSEFSSFIRLSMHPSVNSGEKFSFQLIPSHNAHHSAWHSAVLVHADGSFETVHRKDAEAAQHELVYEEGRPFYFKSHLKNT